MELQLSHGEESSQTSFGSALQHEVVSPSGGALQHELVLPSLFLNVIVLSASLISVNLTCSNASDGKKRFNLQLYPTNQSGVR